MNCQKKIIKIVQYIIMVMTIQLKSENQESVALENTVHKINDVTTISYIVAFRSGKFHKMVLGIWDYEAHLYYYVHFKCYGCICIDHSKLDATLLNLSLLEMRCSIFSFYLKGEDLFLMNFYNSKTRPATVFFC